MNFRLALRLVLLVGMSVCLSGCYVLNQAFVQNSLLNSRRTLSEVIEDEATDQRVRKALVFSRKVIAFAKEKGLNVEDSYGHYVHVEGKAISYVVSAAEPDRLESITWWFPFVGSVPYLGYFDEAKRDAKRDELLEEGYDTSIGQVGAFSSLGYFSDPIYRPMLNRSKASLAHLLFHELVHRTYWSPGSVSFNENLAEFVALYLTSQFFQDELPELELYEKRRRDRRIYKEWIRNLKSELESFYLITPDRVARLEGKKRIFARYLGEKWPQFESQGYDRLKNKEWNHARVLSASLYSPDIERFRKSFSCSGAQSIPEFFGKLDVAESEFDDSFSALDSLCEKG